MLNPILFYPIRLKRLTILTLLSILFTLTACSQNPKQAQRDNHTNDFNSVTLNQSLTLPNGSSRAFIQNGRSIHLSELDHYQPHCRFQVHSPKSSIQILKPDTFKVIEAQPDEETIAFKQTLMLASLSIGIGLNYNLSSNDNNREESYDLIHLYLKPTENTPNIFRLTCAGALGNGSPEEGAETERPNLKNINQILGTIATVEYFYERHHQKSGRRND